MKKKFLLVLMMAVLVSSAIVLIETVVFSKECDCYFGSNSEVRQICVENCRQRIDGGCGLWWPEAQTCVSAYSDVCRTRWVWMCFASGKTGNVYYYKSCPRSCP